MSLFCIYWILIYHYIIILNYSIQNIITTREMNCRNIQLLVICYWSNTLCRNPAADQTKWIAKEFLIKAILYNFSVDLQMCQTASCKFTVQTLVLRLHASILDQTTNPITSLWESIVIIIICRLSWFCSLIILLLHIQYHRIFSGYRKNDKPKATLFT